MTIQGKSVDICIATYKRNESLRKLLITIEAQKLINTTIRVIIVDNDIECSAKKLVEDYFSKSRLAYVYDMQPEKNIALTRNKALSYTTADYIIFVDDDEWAAPNWVETLIAAAQTYNADAVFGPVIPEYPPNTPNWIIEGKFFVRQDKQNKKIIHGATNNALVRNSQKIRAQLKFKPEYGLTGGEDSELFHRLYLNGATLIWCNDALVYEPVSYDRMTIYWLLQRSFRGGQSHARVFHTTQNMSNTLSFFIIRLGYLLFACSLFPFALTLGKARWVWVLRKVMSNSGQLSILFTKTFYQEYK